MERDRLSRLNTYRNSLNLESVTLDTIDEEGNELPNGDEHWNKVIHAEAAKILIDDLSIDKLTTENTINGSALNSTSSSASEISQNVVE